MKRGSVLLVLAALLVSVLGQGVAAAASGRGPGTGGTYAANGAKVDIANVNVTATTTSQKFAIYGRISVQNPTARLYIGLLSNCAGGTKPQAASTRNLGQGKSAVMYVRWVFVAPAPGTYSCRIQAEANVPGRSVGQPNPDGTFEKFTINGADSYIDWAGSSTTQWMTQSPAAEWEDPRYDPEDLLALNKPVDLRQMSWTAPAGVNSFRAVSDLHLTNCYDKGGANKCLDAMGDTYNTKSATVTTRLQVMQIGKTAGTYCKVTNFPASGSQTTVIDWTTHHLKAYHRADVSVSTASNCTRSFRIKLYTTRTAGNPVVAHGGHFSQTLVYP
ncbi:MAG TPA: hypothetical protein VK906_03240 [Egicoccus sp.]|nr:hypothetical protein [Egicoccus sp.]HSK22159.1 hypothetical protein [Egicoccus sp.]